VRIMLMALALSMPVLTQSTTGSGRSTAVAAVDAQTTVSEQTTVVQSFYAEHFKHDMAFSTASVARKSTWLSRDLAQRLRAYLARAKSPHVVPAINGDPFTNTQEYPSAFVVGASSATARGATVPVVMAVGSAKHTVTVVLVRSAKGWLMDDFHYADATTLRQLLRTRP
jgi:hypothetical protein